MVGKDDKDAGGVLAYTFYMSKKPVHVFKKHVFVCVSGKTCPNQGAEDVLKALRSEISELGLKKQICINKAGCFDQCGHGPMIVVYPDQIWYAHVKPSDCSEIVHSHLLQDKPVERLLYDGSGKKS